MDLAVLFSNLVGLFLLIGVGFFVVRSGLLPAEASKPMSTLLMKVTVPATIIHSMIRPFDPGFLRLGGCIFLIGAVIYPLFAGLSLALARLFQVPEGRRGMWCCCTTFCNNGFMGFPVALALFGEEGLTLTVILGIPFNLLLYSVGARMVCMDLPQSRSGHPLSWGRAVFSVINLSMAIGLLLYFTQLPLPQALSAPLGYLSDATTPLSMIITGMNLSQGKAADILRDRDVFTASGTRLLLFPLAAWALIRLIPGVDPLIAGAALINLAMPAPAAAALLGEQYGGCTQLAARTVFLSSLLCIVTIPLVSLLL
ncbi:AEC family transporter [Oscillospiraceae bacterium 44-5]|uniref:AEC family transporter n=1 Tax=Lawsonibacter sp. JLR.KK007 TaxID=3114293 RepID=UPI002FF0F524